MSISHAPHTLPGEPGVTASGPQGNAEGEGVAVPWTGTRNSSDTPFVNVVPGPPSQPNAYEDDASFSGGLSLFDQLFPDFSTGEDTLSRHPQYHADHDVFAGADAGGPQVSRREESGPLQGLPIKHLNHRVPPAADAGSTSPYVTTTAETVGHVPPGEYSPALVRQQTSSLNGVPHPGGGQQQDEGWLGSGPHTGGPSMLGGIHAPLFSRSVSVPPGTDPLVPISENVAGGTQGAPTATGGPHADPSALEQLEQLVSRLTAFSDGVQVYRDAQATANTGSVTTANASPNPTTMAMNPHLGASSSRPLPAFQENQHLDGEGNSDASVTGHNILASYLELPESDEHPAVQSHLDQLRTGSEGLTLSFARPVADTPLDGVPSTDSTGVSVRSSESTATGTSDREAALPTWSSSDTASSGSLTASSVASPATPPENLLLGYESPSPISAIADMLDSLPSSPLATPSSDVGTLLADALIAAGWTDDMSGDQAAEFVSRSLGDLAGLHEADQETAASASASIAVEQDTQPSGTTSSPQLGSGTLVPPGSFTADPQSRPSRVAPYSSFEPEHQTHATTSGLKRG